ncbi:hypothetical protein [Solobacterium moorei]|uniref:hypothetical protein n=1 Tax=Solobacterium moorei TaxID=102148 RepID=UPI00048978A2|nr:hypothetical protein [Solobacterium moorei]BET21232.1 hypothetical protein RGT18_08200 [Solobacterium moorei]
MIVVYEDSIGKENKVMPESYVKLDDVLKIIKLERSFNQLVMKKNKNNKKIVYACQAKQSMIDLITQQIITLKTTKIH